MMGASGNAALAGDTLSLHGSATPIAGTVSSISDAGVTFTVTGETDSTLYTWDRVRAVSSQSFAQAADLYQNTAETLWRARSRLQRGDVELALPLFESVFPDELGRNHETALIAAAGLARCQIAMGQQQLAVIPSLEAIRLLRKGINTKAYDALPEFVDSTFWLPVNLPPVFLASPALARLRTTLENYDAQGDTYIASLAKAYLAAVEQSMPGNTAIAASPPDSAAIKDAGRQLLTRLLALTSATATDRQSARAETLRVMDSLPPFAQAWSRFQLGRSLLAEADLQSQQQGMLNLAYLPATCRTTQPFLAALSLNELSRALDATGDSTAAASIRTDLHQYFPHLAPTLVPLAPVGVTPAQTMPETAPATAPTTQESL
ncbi:MAG TPA: hypothetical protein VG711_11155 [Phycisphaerales bacterium]|nr:hypothetical protein [Phycisphaerales bacterium]